MSAVAIVSTYRTTLDVLVVEDNPGDALLVLELLDDVDHDATVRHVGCIGDALDALAAGPVDCVLLDLDLPDAHGLDGVQRILASGVDAPVIVLTGNDDRRLGQRAVALGAQDYLLKGRIDSERIESSIRHAIDRHQTLRALEASERRVRSMFESVPVPQIAIDLHGFIVEVNAAACSALARSADDLLGRHVDGLLPDPTEPWRDRIGALLDSGRTTVGPVEHRVVGGDGSLVHVKATTTLVFDHTGQVTQLVVLAEDLTVQRRVEHELRAVLARYDGLFEGTHDGVWVIDAAGSTVSVNDQMAAMLGYAPADMIGRYVTDFVAERDRAAFDERLARRRAGITGHARARYQHRDGSVVDVHLTGRPMHDEDGRFVGVIALVSDVTRQRRAEEALRLSEARFRAIVANLSDVVTIHDRDGTIKWASPSAVTVTGFEPEAAIGSTLVDRVHPEDRGVVRAEFESVTRAGTPSVPITFRRLHADGEWRELEAVAVNLLDDPAVEGVVVTARDSTDRRQAERLLAAQALQDPLTELPNRTLFFDRLEQALAHARRNERAVAVMFVDIDRFKSINDSLGHDVGDELLRAIGALLETAVRPGDTVARLGGDEFVVCCDGVESETVVTAIASRLAQRFAVPFSIGGHSFRVTASIGISLSSSDGHSTAEALVRVADAAMYSVKSCGGNGFEIAAADLDDRLQARFTMEERLAEVAAAGRRHRRDWCAVLIDIDRFKSINDRCGHHVGDAAIHAVARELQRGIRTEDVAARWGGDEFLLLLPDTTAAQGHEVAERVRVAVEAVGHLGPDVAITLSLGVASAIDEAPAGVVRRADGALYEAKRAGRNRTAVDRSSPELVVELRPADAYACHVTS